MRVESLPIVSIASEIGTCIENIFSLRWCVAVHVPFPVFQANPAEFMMAAPRRPACHVHASAVLLNGVLALRAILGVSHDPLAVVTLIDCLCNPIFYALAGNWLVLIIGTLKTP